MKIGAFLLIFIFSIPRPAYLSTPLLQNTQNGAKSEIPLCRPKKRLTPLLRERVTDVR